MSLLLSFLSGLNFAFVISNVVDGAVGWHTAMSLLVSVWAFVSARQHQERGKP